MSEVAYLCAGKDCRKRAGEREKLQELLEGLGLRCEIVGCQKICKAPVVGLRRGGALTWYAKLRGKSARKALRRFLDDGTGPLKKHRVKKREGKLR